MQLRFEQTQRQPRPTYRVIHRNTGQQIGTAEASDAQRPTMTLWNQHFDLDIPGKKFRDAQGKKREISPICAAGEERGGIEICFVQTRKILFLSAGYDYRRITLDGVTLTSYEVGMGSGAYYWCIYRDDREMVDMIRKSDRTVNYCNTYTLYLEEESMTAAVCLLTLFIDCTQYPDMGEVVGAALQQESVVTVQKELLARYDPEFIPRIVERDGPLAE